MPEISVNGVKLFYESAGSGPETVVFSHSYLVDHRHFESQMDAVSKHFRVLAFDHRGHGRSEVTTDGYAMESLYRDAVGFIEAMNVKPCHFVGLSTGGFIGLRLGIRRPDLLRSLVLMDTASDVEPPRNRFKYNALFLVLRVLGFRPVMGEALQAMFGPKFLNDPARRDEVELWSRRIRDNDRTALIRFGRGIFSRDSVQDQLGQIKTPTLVVVGEHDRAIPMRRVQPMVDGIPDARLVVIPNGGHLCTIEEPEAVNAALLGFLNEHTDPTSRSS